MSVFQTIKNLIVHAHNPAWTIPDYRPDKEPAKCRTISADIPPDNVVVGRWGEQKRKIVVDTDQETNAPVWELYNGTNASADVPEWTWADAEAVASGRVKLDQYELARPLVLAGRSNQEIAEQLGWSKRKAEGVAARVREAVRQWRENPSPAPREGGRG